MVKYCCVYGCGRNTKSKELSFHRLPKEKHRMEEWLKLCGRTDIVTKLSTEGRTSERWSYLVCNRHFTPKDYSFKLTKLKPNCKPSLYLPPPDAKAVIAYSDEEDSGHEDILCNSCEKPITGFRYKCVSCKDYDLCRACELKDQHAEHFMLRMPKNLELLSLEKLMSKWREVIEKMPSRAAAEGSDSSDDDVPITRYRSYDSGVELAEDVKDNIRKEVNRVLNLKPEELKRKKLQIANKKKRDRAIRATEIENTEREVTPPDKRLKLETDKEQISNSNISSSQVAGIASTEVVFADVNNIDLKSERTEYLNMMPASSSQGTIATPSMPMLVPQMALLQSVQDGNQLPATMVSSLPYPEVPVLSGPVDQRPVMHVKLSDDLTELMVEVTSNNQKTFYKI